MAVKATVLVTCVKASAIGKEHLDEQGNVSKEIPRLIRVFLEDEKYLLERAKRMIEKSGQNDYVETEVVINYI